jgi:pyrroloquinoline quinone biosynthesis protein D
VGDERCDGHGAWCDDVSAQPRLAPGFRLQWEPAQSAHVLLYPEGMVKLNQSAAEILKRCNGERDIDQIVNNLESAFGVQGLASEVHDFLAMATQQGWVRLGE